MQEREFFEIVHRATRRTRLKAPKGCRTEAQLAGIRERLILCDGIEDVLVNPKTGSVVVRHEPDFCWGSIGADLLPLGPIDPAPAPPSQRVPQRHEPRPFSFQDIALWAVGAAISRQPAMQLVQELALTFLATAVRDARRA